MKKIHPLHLFTYAVVIVAFVIIQLLRKPRRLGSLLEGQLVPICAYVTMALALNLVVGVLGELSLGHAGFMSIGAFSGICRHEPAGQSCHPPSRPAPGPGHGGGRRAPLPASSASSSASRCCASTATTWPSSPWPSARSSRASSTVYLGVDENGLHFSFLTDKNIPGLGEGGRHPAHQGRPWA